MEILLVAAELSPWARTTDAAETIAALAKTLRQQGHAVSLAIPRLPAIDGSGLLLARRLTPLPLPGGGEATVFDGQLPSGVRLLVLDHPGAAALAGQSLDAAGAVAFSGAAAALVQHAARQGRAFEVVHLHGAAAALVAPLLGELTLPFEPSVVLTLHDPGRDVVLGPPERASLPQDLVPPEGRHTLLSLGAATANRVVVEREAVKRELLDATRYPELAAALAARDDAPVVIEPGIDISLFNPATDSTLAARFDAEEPSGKLRCKHALLRELHLEMAFDPERPLAVLLVPRPPVHPFLVHGATRALLRQSVTLVIAGALEEDERSRLEELARRTPGRAAVVPDPGDARLRGLLAAADLALLAPTPRGAGHLHLVAQRYGAVPVALAAGAAETGVVDVDARLVTGTGYLYDEPTEDALVGAAERALAHFGTPAFRELRRRVLRLDVGWDRPARRHLQVYAAASPRAA